MSTPAYEPQLDPCGCCETELPQPTRSNRPGQPALAFRIGTHATFLHRMLARLHARILSSPTDEGPSLSALATRVPDDPSIALLDAWATVADVLTFYQERIANEGYLRTATERRSILELARAIGYELNPGVAASTYLAFTVDDSPGSSEEVTVPEGTQVQSVPASQDELPQVFETVEEIEARAAWNALQPRTELEQAIGPGTSQLYLRGVSTNLQPGDVILIVGDHRENWPGSERWDTRILQTVTAYAEDDYTLVTWEEALGHQKPTVTPADNPRVFAFRQRAALFGYNAPDWRAMSEEIKKAYGGDNWNRRRQWPDFKIKETDDHIDLDAVYPKILEGSWVVLMRPGYVELYKVKETAADSRTDFTLTAKVTRLTFDTAEHLSWFGLRDTVVLAQSEELELGKQPCTLPVFGKWIVLDQVVDDLQKGQTLIVSGRETPGVEIAPRTRVVRTADTEVLEEEPLIVLISADGSQTIELEAGDQLDLLAVPVSEANNQIKLHLEHETGFAGFVTLAPRDFIALPADEARGIVSEVVVVVDRVESDESNAESTVLFLEDALQHAYDATTVEICGNVAKATHGETVEEVLGSGDGALAHQRFKLKKPPLTYVSAATASGGQSTLEVRVNDVLWEEAASLYGLDARSERYTVRIADDGTPSLVFGDGESGARLPTGLENVVATYRSGTGSDGELDAEALTLLKTRPLGIREVTNPVAASGAADLETLDNARANAPLTVLTLDRIVSLRDFEDFARAFSGISKACAVALWDGETRLVHVTIASSSGDPIDASSALYTNLVKAIQAASDPTHTFLVSDYEPSEFNLKAKVRTDPRYVADDVMADAAAALEEAFAFERRALGQPVTAAEVIHVISQVSGVIAVDLDQLYLTDDPSGPQQEMPEPILPAISAEWSAATNEIRPAELLLLNTAGVVLLKMEERP
ncbi:MAG: putative baseplate assembly protein [Anaerolineae bacterium]|jgi:predicted phage baseplate assembly protein